MLFTQNKTPDENFVKVMYKESNYGYEEDYLSHSSELNDSFGDLLSDS